jgi:hypothetical protein
MKAGDRYKCTDSPYDFIYTGSLWQPFAYGFACTEPVDGDFSWVSQGSASTNTTNGGIYLHCAPDSANTYKMRVKSAPTAPYTFTIMFVPMIPTANYAIVAVILRESSSGRFNRITLLQESGVQHIGVGRNTDPPTEAAGQDISWMMQGLQPVFYRVVNDNTNLAFSWSPDGYHWQQLQAAESKTGFMSSGPDQIGFSVNPRNGSYDVGMHVLSFSAA